MFPKKKQKKYFPHPGPPRNRPAGDDSFVGAVEVADAEGGLGAVPEWLGDEGSWWTRVQIINIYVGIHYKSRF